MKNQKNETQIAIIGATQSGKTTLAAGLAKTSSPEFTVGFANQATSDYFQPRIAGIAAGHWPEGNIGEDKDLGLKINTPGGRVAMISFKEYMGERMNDENYLEHIVGNPNGALILLSPGMGLLTDPMKREKLIGNLKGIVDYLKSNKCVAIAFVVTACDRLKTDLKDFAEEFGNYAAEVTNYLNTSGMDWKRFDVTITGELADQQKPSIAVGDKNTAREPFVWIMDRVAGRKHMTAAKRVVGWLSGLALVVLAAFGAIRGVQYYSDCADLRTREKAVAGIEGKIASAVHKKSESDLKLATDELAALIASSKVHQCRFQCCEARRTNDVAKWSKVYDEARTSYFSVSIDKRFDGRAKSGTEENCVAFDRLLSEFAPTDLAKKTALTNRWAQLRPKIREGYDVESGNRFSRQLSELKQKGKDKGLLGSVRDFKNEVSKWKTDFDSSQNIRTNVLSGAEQLIQSIEAELDLQAYNNLQSRINKIVAPNVTPDELKDLLEKLRQDIANFEPYTKDGKTNKEKLSRDFEDKCPGWKQANWDSCCATNAEDVVRKIRDLNPNDSSLRSDVICGTLKTAYGFTNEWAKASSNVLSAATNKIDGACLKFLADFLNSFTNKWKVTDRRPPEVCKCDNDFIVAALDLSNPKKPDEKLFADFLNKLEQARKNAEKKWIEHRKELVDKFVSKIRSMPVETMYDEYRNMYDRDTFDLFIDKVRPEVKDTLSKLAKNVDSVVEQMVSEFFDDYLQELKRAFWESESAFNSVGGRMRAIEQFSVFQKLCLALNRSKCGLEGSWCTEFAQECVNNGNIKGGMNKAFEQNLDITRVDASAGDGCQFEPIIVKQWHDKWEDRNVLTATDEQIADGNYTGDGWRIISQKSTSLSLNPWTKSGFFVYAEVEEVGSNPKGDIIFRVFPRQSDYAKGYIERTWRVGKHECTIRIYCNFEGHDIFELYKECKRGK